MINKKKLLTIFLFVSLFFVALKANPVFAQDSELEDKEADQYTLLPLMVNGGIKTYNSLAENLILDQGYEVHCAHTSWRIKKSVWGDIAAYFSADNKDPNPPVIFGGTDPYIGDFSKARIPMIRGMENTLATVKNSSFEGMFGANYRLEDSERYETNSSGVAQKLLDSYQQCFFKAKNVDAVVKICNTIKEVSDFPCTLDKKYQLLEDPVLKIPRTEFKTSDIQSYFKSLHPELEGDDRIAQVCADITAPPEEIAMQTIDTDKLNLTRAAINAINIDLDNLYRMAFLVLVPTQDPMDGEDKFHFLQSNANINAKKHAPIILAFKIPDFATNKSKKAGNIDSLELTKMVLQSEDQNKTDLGVQGDLRETLLELTKAAKNIPENEKIIKCEGFPQCKRSNDNLLVNLLIDMINAKQPICETETLVIPDLNPDNATESAATETVAGQIFNQEDLNWEKAGDLFTPASKDLKSYDYRMEINDYFVNQLFSNTEEDFNWQLEIDKNPPEPGDEIVVNGYLVLPIGETLKDVNKSLAIFWNEVSFVEMITENTLVDMDGKAGAFPKYLTIKNENTGFKAGGSHQFCMDYGYVQKVVDGETILAYDCIDKRQFGVNVGDTKKDLLFPDFGLGWMIRKIQQTLRSTINDTYDYIQSCERVEDMFLGRCSGKDKDSDVPATCDGEAFAKITGMPSYGGVSTYAKEYFDAYIKSKITTENMAAYAAAEEATGIPCEIAAAIHINEGGMNADQSLFDGGSLRGTLEEDAIAAMHHLLDKITALGGDVNNLEYKLLVEAIGNYNGPGNQNCSDPNTRWSQGGKCPPEFTNEDHAYVTAFLDERHKDMDGLFCIDFVKFDCTTTATTTALDAIKARVAQFRPTFTEAQLQEHADKAAELCFSDGAVCSQFSNGNKFPARTGPGAIPNAIMIHELGN